MDELQLIQSRIYEIRGQKVMLDFDLAEMYEVETRALNQAVKRNIERFPGGLHVSTDKRRNIELEITNCDVQFYKDGYETFSLCFYGIRSCYA